MDVTVKYEGTSGENQGGFCYFYLKFVSPEFQKVRVENIIMEPPSSRNQVYLSYMHVYDKDTLEYICSSSNATRALVPPDNLPGIWKFEKRLLLENDKTYLYTFTTSSAPSLTNLYATRTKNWPSTTASGALDVNSRGSGTATYPGTEIAYYPAITFQGEAVPVYGGSVEVGNGYYNADGVNKIIFSNPVKKDFEAIGGTKGFKNNVVLTLDNSDMSSFILQGVEAGEPTGYKATKALDKVVYLSNNKDMILGESPKEGLEIGVVGPSEISVSEGYVYSDESIGYLSVDKGQKGLTTDVVGSLTITPEFVVSGFSTTDGLKLPQNIPSGTQDIEIFLHVMTGSSFTTGAKVFTAGGLHVVGRIFIETSTSQMFASYYNGSWQSAVLVPSLSTNTEYWLHVKYSNSTGRLFTEYSTDGSNYTQAADNSFSLGFATDLGLYLGTNLEDSQAINVFSGKIYLQDCKMYLDNEEWWNGVGYIDKRYTLQETVVHPEDFEEESEPVETPFARPNLTSNDSYGIVSDILGTPSSSTWAPYKALDNNTGTYSGLRDSSISEFWWKWVLPHKLSFDNNSVIIFKKRTDSSEGCSGFQFYADSDKNTPLGNSFSSTSDTRITLSELTNPIITDTIFLYNPSTSSWPGMSELQFENVGKVEYGKKIGYLSLANPSGTTKLIATGMRNPTKDYTGSVVTPVDLAKKITLSEDLSEILSVEDI